jgi:hypothetical protein
MASKVPRLDHPSEPDALARDLVASRREAAALRRENDRLRARLTPGIEVWHQPAHELAGAMRCRRCGLTLHGGAIQHDQTLVFASCCPRCDGPLLDALGT